MDHVVYLDAKANELANLIAVQKTMIIRGAAGRKIPYGRVAVGDSLYFINNNAEGVFKAKAVVKHVLNSEKLTKEESAQLVEQHQAQLQLTAKQMKRWSGKRYLVLIEVEGVAEITPFKFDKGDHTNMDDWLCIEKIDAVKG